ncbi:hypothetical protein ON010_g943 [Phytophthora cinnamomi]|nr:hypothetical protein ON010_g943 [Phytophthora cinnamomi]
MAVVEALRIELGAARQLRNCSPQVFELLESRIDARLYELEDALKMMQQPMVSTDTDLIERQCGSAVGALEVAHTGLFPFDKDTVSTTMWSFFEVGKFPDGELSVVSRRSEDGFSMNTRVIVQLSGGGDVSIDTHAVMKRFAAADDVFTMMTESCSTWTVSIPKAATWRHSTREEASFLLRNYSTDGGSVSQVQTTFRLKPEENADVLNCCPLAEPRAIEEIVIPSFRKLLKARHRFVENALFDAIRHQ